jgi:hypothetical protein
MSIIERVKRLVLSPVAEWPVIADEKAEPIGLFSGYVLPLASLAAVAALIGQVVVGTTIPLVGTVRTPLMAGIATALFTLVMTVISIFVVSLIINTLATTFGGQKNSKQALKVAVYSCTPIWVAGVLQILPMLSILMLLGAVYGLYLLYLGLLRLMKPPEDKALGYTAAVVACTIALMFVVAGISAATLGTGMFGSGMLNSASSGGSGTTVDPNSALGRLEALGTALEENARKAEAAEKAGDQGAQAAAAFETLGTLLGGGARVEPMSVDEIKQFVPETFAGMPRRSSNAEKGGLGVTISRIEATYGDGEKEVTLELVDSGGMAGLLGVASWMGAQTEKEDEDGYERTRQVGGRYVHEKVSKRGRNEFGLVVGERFLVSAEGRGVDIDILRDAVSSLDLARLESMKAEK